MQLFALILRGVDLVYISFSAEQIINELLSNSPRPPSKQDLVAIVFDSSSERNKMLRRTESPSTRISFSLKTELLCGFQRNSRSRIHRFRNLSVTDPV